MTTAHIIAGDLRANLADRIVSGILLPFGEVGSTNLGKFSIDGPGIITIPKDISVLNANEDHDQLQPRARFLSVTETPAGMFATFKMGDNPEGDDLLAAIDNGQALGKPKSLSVEIKDMRIKAGKGISGLLAGAAFLDRGAFPSARLLAAAVDTVDPAVTDPAAPAAPAAGQPTTTVSEFSEKFTDENGVERVRKTVTTTTVDGDTTTIKTLETITDPIETEDPAVTTATAPNTLNARHHSGGARSGMTKGEVFAALHAIRSGSASDDLLARLEKSSGPAQNSLFAALSDVKFDGTGGVGVVMGQPQWVGELWDGVAYEQQILPLFGHADLTAKKIDGWKWETKPTGGTWAGNKAAVPSGTLTAVPYTTNAMSFAGGHDIAREHLDFNTPGFFESYFAAMAESYARWADVDVTLTKILAGSTSVEADNPAGLSIGAGLSAIIDGASEVIGAEALPSFALVAPALWKQIMKTPNDSTLGYLSAALGLKDGQLASFVIRPSSLLGAGQVLVGAREAATVYELGGTPIRVEAPDMVKGGLDTGVFGYAGVVIHKSTALQLVTPYTA